MPQVEGDGRGKIVTAPDGTRYYADTQKTTVTTKKNGGKGGGKKSSGRRSGGSRRSGTDLSAIELRARLKEEEEARKAAREIEKEERQAKRKAEEEARKAKQKAMEERRKKEERAEAMAQLMGFLEQQLNEELVSAQRWYDNQMMSVEDLYKGMDMSLAQERDQTLEGLKSDYDAGKKKTNKGIDNQLTEAYVQKMMNERGLGQKMAALGQSGGPSESILLGLANLYGKNVSALETTRASALSDQWLAYNNAKRDAEGSYLKSLSSNKNNLIKDKQSVSSSYADMISKARGEYDKRKATALQQMI